jgi:hypothetical protein
MFNQFDEPKKSNKLMNGIYLLLIIIATALLTYYLSDYVESKKEKAEKDKLMTKLEEVDKRLTEEEKKDIQQPTVVSPTVVNPYDCTYMGGCSRLYPTYPYNYSYNPYYPYDRYNIGYNLGYNRRDILRGGNIDLHKRRH